MFGFIRDVFVKRKFGPSIIVVSGLPRSGTSMMMRMLDAADLEIVTDRIRVADQDNPKGYFEDERVKELDKTEDKSWLRDCRGKVVKIVSFLLKELPDDHHYRVIFMRRDLREVIASQNKMLVRRGEPVDNSEGEKTIKMYELHLRKVEYLLEEKPGFDCLYVPYAEVLDRPREYAETVAAFLGLKLDVDKMAAAVDRSLYRNRREVQPEPAR